MDRRGPDLPGDPVLARAGALSVDWTAAIGEAMAALASTRPVFHSEADFQLGLAWTLREREVVRDVRLEYPHPREKRQRIDIVGICDGERVAIEVKYWKRRATIRHGGETFDLTEQGAHDLSRYDFWSDVARVEDLVDLAGFAFGCALTLTNDARYWIEPSRPGGLDEAFRLHQGRAAPREMAWARLGTGTSKGREAPLAFRRDHVCGWRPYAEVDGHELRWCAVPVWPQPVGPGSGPTGDPTHT